MALPDSPLVAEVRDLGVQFLDNDVNISGHRVLDEIGIQPVSYPTMNRRLPTYATDKWRRILGAGFADLVWGLPR